MERGRRDARAAAHAAQQSRGRGRFAEAVLLLRSPTVVRSFPCHSLDGDCAERVRTDLAKEDSIRVLTGLASKSLSLQTAVARLIRTVAGQGNLRYPLFAGGCLALLLELREGSSDKTLRKHCVAGVFSIIQHGAC